MEVRKIGDSTTILITIMNIKKNLKRSTLIKEKGILRISSARLAKREHSFKPSSRDGRLCAGNGREISG
jgi:hypothetical protein